MAVMLMLGLVVVLMNAHAKINEIVSDPALAEGIEKTHSVETQKGELALGKGRGGSTAYSRWYIV